MIRKVNYFILALICIQTDLVYTQKNDKIFERLEHLESKVEKVGSLESEIESLKSEVQNLVSVVQYLRAENNLLKKGFKDDKIKFAKDIKRQIGNSLISDLDPSVFAFSAELTKNLDKRIGQSHTFVYDHVKCNYGGAYSNISGIFTAPKSGIFAFLWTIMAEGTLQNVGEVITELVVNSEVRGRAQTDTEVTYDDDQATGFVIVHLNQGDLVFIRSHDVPQGNLQVNYKGGWTFSGWQIA